MKKQLRELDVEVLKQLVDEMNSWDGYNEYLHFYEMGEINEFYYSVEPLEVLIRAHFGDFNPMDDYFNFNGYGNLVSYSEYDMYAEIEKYRDEIIEDALIYHDDGHIDLYDYIEVVEL